METAYLSLGSNRGDRKALLTQATDLIRQRVGSVVCCSPLYETPPWGEFAEGEDLPFLNMALAVETALEPQALLMTLKEIEGSMGRHTPQSLRDSSPNLGEQLRKPLDRGSHSSPKLGREMPVAFRAEPCAQVRAEECVDRVYHSRPIDIDIVLYGMAVTAMPELVLPHPRMHLRRFVLQPLCDIAPDLQHPLLKKTIKQLLEECPDTSLLSCCS